MKELTSLVGHSNYIRDDFRETLRKLAESAGLDPVQILGETDDRPTMEGLYLKIEDGGQVVGRLKFVRFSFLQTVLTSNSHWLERPIIPNQLARPIEDLFLEELPPLKTKGNA